jgi:hypothetical protein
VKALQGDSSQPLYSQYMVASKTTSTFEEAKKTFQGFKNMEFCSFDVEGSIAELTLDAQSYDLAILSEVSEKLELLKGALVLMNHRLMISRIVPSNS